MPFVAVSGERVMAGAPLAPDAGRPSAKAGSPALRV